MGLTATGRTRNFIYFHLIQVAISLITWPCIFKVTCDMTWHDMTWFVLHAISVDLKITRNDFKLFPRKMLNAVYPILKHHGYCRRYPFYTINWCQPQEMWKLEISSFVMTSTHLWLAVPTCTSTAPLPPVETAALSCAFCQQFSWLELNWVQLGGQLLTVTNTRMIRICQPLLQSRWLKSSLWGKKTKRQQFYRQKLCYWPFT